MTERFPYVGRPGPGGIRAGTLAGKKLREIFLGNGVGEEGDTLAQRIELGNPGKQLKRVRETQAATNEVIGRELGFPKGDVIYQAGERRDE